MTTLELDSVVQDVYGLFEEEQELNEEHLEAFGENMKQLLRDRFETTREAREPHIRCSNLGVKDRKLYYDMHMTKEEANAKKFKPSDLMKFLYGDLIEELLLFLVKQSGHVVEGEQGEVEIDGVIGHRDCIIDGITVDIKSASKYAFQKFAKGTLHKDDPFGYISQISSYAYADKSPYGAFLAMCKETGQLALLKVDPIDMIHPPSRVAHVREMIEKPEPPPKRCYEAEPLGTSGNMVLPMSCSAWCPHKNTCWADVNNGDGLRSFQYSNGVKDFVTVAKTPLVDEIFKKPTE